MDIISFNEAATANGRIDILDSTTVKLTGDQTIEDVKTFTSSPIVPTPTADFQTATKQYVDNHTSDTVLYTPQTLNDAQKAQARENIDAASTNELNAIPKPNLFINPLFQIWLHLNVHPLLLF